MEQTIRHFLLVVFCQKNFLWTCDSEAFFSGCLLSENFLWRWNNVVFFFFLSFVNMGMGAWRWDSVKFFFLVVILPSPIPVALAPKKIYHMISVLNNIDHCRCPLAIYCKKKLSHDFSSHQYWLLPLPITIANPCCPLLLHIVVSSNFLDVRMEAWGQELGNGSMGMWAWSMGMGAWRLVSDAFFLVVFCKIFLIKMGQWGNFFGMKILSIFYMWGWKHLDRSMGRGAWGCDHA